MADRDRAGWLLLVLAAACLLPGLAGGDRAWFLAGIALAAAAGAVAVLGPTPAQRDARGRNPRPPHARRVR